MKTIFKQGDTVYHWNLGQGEILEIKDELNCMSGYLRVMFDNQVNVYRFRLDGSEWNGPPVLSFKPYDLVNGGFTQERPRPDLKEGQLIYVKYPQGLADRYNDTKPKWSLVDFEALIVMVRVLEYGAKKYAPDNWKKGLYTKEISESLLRHLFAYLSGETIDPESGLPHVGHILCNAMFLSHFDQTEFDNR